MDRDAERTAFARACSFLNFQPTAKWAAHVAAGGTALLFVFLLVLLGLFADLMVNRGQLPAFRELPESAQQKVLAQWDAAATADRLARLAPLDLAPGKRQVLASTNSASLPPPDRDLVGSVQWRLLMEEILRNRVGEDAAAAASPEQVDQPAHGVLSLVVRADAMGNFYAPVVGWLASWNPWMWYSSSERAFFSPYLVGLLLLTVVILLARTGLSLLLYEMAARASIEAATRLRRAVYHHTFRLGTLAFRALGPSEAVTVFTRHVEAVHDALHARLTVYYREPIKFGLVVLFALVVNPILALVFALFAFLVWALGGRIAAHFKEQGRLATNQASERLTLIRESLMMMRLVKTYMMELFNQSRVERQLARLADAQRQAYRGEKFARPLLILLGSLAAVILLYVAGIIVLNGGFSVPGAVVMATALVSLYWPLETWLAEQKVLKRGREAAVQLFRFLDRPSEVGQAVGAEFLPGIDKVIEFDNVSLREPGSGRMLLQEVTLSIKAGQRVGLIGPDDLEKHALCYLIPRLLDPTSGEIRIDEHNLRWVTLDSLRDKIAIVLQHNLIFRDTVANNISCGDPAYTLPRVIEAAKMARAHQFIQKLPQGYETEIGELGHSLTLSQKFRIALARAILRDPALLIIEEPEEDVEEEAKALIDDALARFLPGRTVIFLPHRISTIKSCDRLYLLHKGRIEAAGVHKELLAQSKLYRHLHYLEFNEMAEIV